MFLYLFFQFYFLSKQGIKTLKQLRILFFPGLLQNYKTYYQIN